MARHLELGCAHAVVYLTLAMVCGCQGDAESSETRSTTGSSSAAESGGDAAGADSTDSSAATGDEQNVDSGANADASGGGASGDDAGEASSGEASAEGESAEESGESGDIEPCDAPQIECEGRCVDPQAHVLFCGAAEDCRGDHAGEVCERSEVCKAGQCVAGAWGPAEIIGPLDPATMYGEWPQLVGDGRGNVVALWHRGTRSGGRVRGVELRRYDARNEVWLGVEDIGAQRTPFLAGDGKGRVTVAWIDDPVGGEPTILERYIDTPLGPWSPVRPVHGPAEPGKVIVSAAYGSDGQVAMAWLESDGFEAASRLMVAQRLGHSAIWSEPQIIDEGMARADAVGYANLSFDAKGALMIGWERTTQYPPRLSRAWSRRFVDIESGWLEKLPLEPDHEDASNSVTLHLDARGHMNAIWIFGGNLRFSRLNPEDHTWSPPEIILGDDRWESEALKVVSDAAGNLAVIVRKYSTDGVADILINRYAVATGQWQTTQHLEDWALGNAWRPDLAVAPHGAAVGVWQQVEGEILDGGILSSHLRAFNLLDDTLMPTVDLSSEGEGHMAVPKVVGADDGTFMVIWMHETDADQPVGTARIWAMRYGAGR